MSIITYIESYPTCDIHLLLNGPGGGPTNYQLEVREFLGRNLTLDAKTTYSDSSSAIAVVLSTGLIIPKGVGETFCRIRYTDWAVGAPDRLFVSEIIVRIRVHQSLASFWIGNNQVTLTKDRDDYVVSVYGVFNDGTIGDISSHPFLGFSSSDSTTVEINDSNDKGRMKGVKETGGGPVKIRVSYGAQTEEVSAFVRPSLSAPRRILECVHGAGKVNERRNILFLSDGFVASQKALFTRLVILIKDGLFGSLLHSPFSTMKDSFNVWMVFDPSPEEGITAGDFIGRAWTGPGVQRGQHISNFQNVDDPAALHRLIVQVGLPDRYHPRPLTVADARARWHPSIQAEDNTVKAWLGLYDYFLLQAKDSIFGYMNGPRYGDRDSYTIADPLAPPPSVMHWYHGGSYVSVRLDRRRRSRNWRYTDFFEDYLRSLRTVDGNENVSDTWLDGDKDENLVALILNSALLSGSRDRVALRISPRQRQTYDLRIAGRRADHDVPAIEPLSIPALQGASIDVIVGVLAHEFGHAFELLDEYEGDKFVGTGLHDVLQKNDPGADEILRSNNLTHHYRIERAPGDAQIDMEKVKWRWLHRITRCSTLINDPTVIGGGRLRIQVGRKERFKWIWISTHGDDVYLRSRGINADLVAFFCEGPLKILEVQDDGSVILATGSSKAKRGDVLYQPEVADGQPLTVFHPDVWNHLKFHGVPFAKKSDPSVMGSGVTYPDLRLILNFKPRHPESVVGVYEGGGTYNTRVYRSSGSCKMRMGYRVEFWETAPLIVGDQIIAELVKTGRFLPYCYLCRYAIVSALDPTYLEGLPYPE